jgi:hypothetical protein
MLHRIKIDPKAVIVDIINYWFLVSIKLSMDDDIFFLFNDHLILNGQNIAISQLQKGTVFNVKASYYHSIFLLFLWTYRVMTSRAFFESPIHVRKIAARKMRELSSVDPYSLFGERQ